MKKITYSSALCSVLLIAGCSFTFAQEDVPITSDIIYGHAGGADLLMDLARYCLSARF